MLQCTRHLPEAEFTALKVLITHLWRDVARVPIVDEFGVEPETPKLGEDKFTALNERTHVDKIDAIDSGKRLHDGVAVSLRSA